MDTPDNIELPAPTPEIQQVLDAHPPVSLPGNSLTTLEGIDGAGKSTVLGALAHALDDTDREIVLTTEPDDSTMYGQAVRHAIKDDQTPPLAVFFTFLADHAHHYFTKVHPALDRGAAVVSDRYIDSRYAYQAYALEEFVAAPDTYIDRIWNELLDMGYPDISFQSTTIDGTAPETLFFIALARAAVADEDTLHPQLRSGSVTLNLEDALAHRESDLADMAADPLSFLLTAHDYTDALDWIQHLQEYNGWSRHADTTLFIDISVEESFARKADDSKETFEKDNFLTAVRENYHELNATEDRFVRVNGEQPPAAVVEETLTALPTDE